MWQQYWYNDPVGKRPYCVYTPESYQVGTVVPLFVMLHGCGQTALDFATGTSMNVLAEQYGFIVVYPQQTRTYNQGLCWNWFLPVNQSRGHGEPAYIVGIIQDVQNNTALWTIDPTRIYVAGLSAGAAMAVILGVTYPDVFAAIGIHSGLEYQAATNLHSGLKAMRRGGPDPQQQGLAAYTAMSDLSRIVPTIVFHGTKDTTVAPVNGDQLMQQWMETDHLASKDTYAPDFTRPTSVTSGQVPGGYAYVIATWNAANGNEVQAYWKIGGLGHAWSGGNSLGTYTDRRGPDASLAVYNFFMAHALGKSDTQRVPPQTKLRHILTDLFKVKRG
ncbi:MAG TPA: PHB depolymerase family esterase [Ktedonobacteraceae bacterium]